jgi:hypothetical protein
LYASLKIRKERLQFPTEKQLLFDVRFQLKHHNLFPLKL